MEEDSFNIFQIFNIIYKNILQIIIIAVVFTLPVLSYFQNYYNFKTVQVGIYKIEESKLKSFNEINKIIKFNTERIDIKVQDDFTFADITNNDLINSRFISNLKILSAEEFFKRFITKFERNKIFTQIIYDENFKNSENPDEASLRSNAYNYASSFQIHKIASPDREEKVNYIKFNTIDLDEDISNLRKAISSINNSIVSDLILEIEEAKEQIIFNNTIALENINKKLDMETNLLLGKLDKNTARIKDQLKIAESIGLNSILPTEYNNEAAYNILQSLYQYESDLMTSIYFEGLDVLEKKLELIDKKKSHNLENEKTVIYRISINHLLNDLKFVTYLDNFLNYMKDNSSEFKVVDINLNDLIIKPSSFSIPLIILLSLVGLIIAILLTLLIEGYRNYSSRE